MNRELKFRCFDTEEKIMITSGWYFNETRIGLSKYAEGYGSDTIGFLNVSDRYNIMQFTGLNDKNGTPIYEGDILKTINGNWGVIVYKAPSFELTVSETQSSLYMAEWLSQGEVIGNIYEHQELLKQP